MEALAKLGLCRCSLIAIDEACTTRKGVEQQFADNIAIRHIGGHTCHIELKQKTELQQIMNNLLTKEDNIKRAIRGKIKRIHIRKDVIYNWYYRYFIGILKTENKPLKLLLSYIGTL